MKKYEVMFIVKPDLKEEEKNAVLKAIKDQIAKHQGVVTQEQVWAERRKLAFDIFPIGGGVRYREGMYYLVNFDVNPGAISLIRSAYGLNEGILRHLIVTIDEKKSAPVLAVKA